METSMKLIAKGQIDQLCEKNQSMKTAEAMRQNEEMKKNEGKMENEEVERMMNQKNKKRKSDK